jgi:hypothetical protein
MKQPPGDATEGGVVVDHNHRERHPTSVPPATTHSHGENPTP